MGRILEGKDKPVVDGGGGGEVPEEGEVLLQESTGNNGGHPENPQDSRPEMNPPSPRVSGLLLRIR